MDHVRPLLRSARKGRPGPRTPNDNLPFASVAPGLRDRALRSTLQAAALAWRVCGLREGSRTLRHYLDGSGAPLTVDPSALLRTPAFHRPMVRHFHEWRRFAAAEFSRTGVQAFDVTNNWHGVLIPRRNSLDWWLALRGLQYHATGELTLLPDVPVYDGLPAARLTYRVEIFKDWNFDKGESEFGVPFGPIARLHETGLAREFEVVGSSSDLEWTYGVH
jgi:hypothetical protein